jgi:hypothetical protein
LHLLFIEGIKVNIWHISNENLIVILLLHYGPNIEKILPRLAWRSCGISCIDHLLGFSLDWAWGTALLFLVIINLDLKISLHFT